MRNVLIAFGIVIGVGLAVLGLKAAFHSDVQSAHAEITKGSASGPAISAYEIQAHAKNLPVQEVKEPF